VSLWWFFLNNNEPQRHRAHRGCTEKNSNGRLFVQSLFNLRYPSESAETETEGW
jgi:hypothetical protein